MRRVKKITISVHPSLYSKMEQLRVLYKEQSGITLTQREVTNMISKRIRIPNKINIIGKKDVIKKKR